MPLLRFPKRDTEGLPAALVDNNNQTTYTISSSSPLTVTYASPKFVYAIIVISSANATDPPVTSDNVRLQVTADGTLYHESGSYITHSNVTRAIKNAYFWVNRTIKGWKLITSEATLRIGEVIVLVPDDTKPYLTTVYPDNIEILDNGTSSLDYFSNLSTISDGDDNTYATFAFRGGYTTYTLYLQASFSMPMLSVITPFLLAEIDVGSSNVGGIINENFSHGYFHWGAVKSISHTSSYFPRNSDIPQTYGPSHLWTQRVHEDITNDYFYVWAAFGSPFSLNPANYARIYPPSAGTALLEALPPNRLIWDGKTLYVPYFFSLPHRPLFIARKGYHIYYATNTTSEPIIYVAASGQDGVIYLNFGLRIQTSIPVNSQFFLKIYGLGFLCFPQIDVEIPLVIPAGAVWYEHVPLNTFTRDNNETTESPDITTDEKIVTFYPAAVDVSSGRAIRYRIRSTSGGTSTFNVDRYYGFHRTSDDSIVWYYKRDSYSVGNTLQSFDVTGADQYGQTKVIKVEIKPT
jgi:hypothetical protein